MNNKDKPYYQRVLEATGELPGQQNKGFTTVGNVFPISNQKWRF